jgi:hypothetical protein
MKNTKLIEVSCTEVDATINWKEHKLITTYNDKNELVIKVIYKNRVVDIITVPNSIIYSKQLRHRL